MASQCPHLEYRTDGETHSFETERAYCAIAEAYVQPMRADICNHRYDLHEVAHCEIFREADGDE